MATTGKFERALETTLFASRWLLAPLYLGMILALAVIMIVFARELFTELAHVTSLDDEGAILLSLSLIDLSLTGNLLIIVMFSGYETFVSKLHTDADVDRPAWMGKIDFSGLKLKLIASIAAISAIALLRAFLPLGDSNAPVDGERIRWMVVIHLTFVVSGVLLAAMDWITSKVGGTHGKSEAAAALDRDGGSA
jgi:uncharacterized protein (TIGR00645 family)